MPHSLKNRSKISCAQNSLLKWYQNVLVWGSWGGGSFGVFFFFLFVRCTVFLSLHSFHRLSMCVSFRLVIQRKILIWHSKWWMHAKMNRTFKIYFLVVFVGSRTLFSVVCVCVAWQCHLFRFTWNRWSRAAWIFVYHKRCAVHRRAWHVFHFHFYSHFYTRQFFSKPKTWCCCALHFFLCYQLHRSLVQWVLCTVRIRPYSIEMIQCRQTKIYDMHMFNICNAKASPFPLSHRKTF